MKLIVSRTLFVQYKTRDLFTTASRNLRDRLWCASVGLQLRAYKNISDYVIVLLPTTLTTIINNNKPLHNIMLDVELLGSV